VKRHYGFHPAPKFQPGAKTDLFKLVSHRSEIYALAGQERYLSQLKRQLSQITTGKVRHYARRRKSNILCTELDHLLADIFADKRKSLNGPLLMAKHDEALLAGSTRRMQTPPHPNGLSCQGWIDISHWH